MIRIIDERLAVAPQVRPEDVPALAAAGWRTLVNNRPDGEEPGQPRGDAVRAAAEGAGMRYVAIPVGQAGLTHEALDAMAAELATGERTVAFCRSGTRSCNLWALAAAKRGGDADAIVAGAANAGYDVSGLRPVLERLSTG